MCQVEEPEKTFQYEMGEEKVLLTIMSRINWYMTKQVKHEGYTSSMSDRALVKAKINAQLYLLGKGLKKFGEAGEKASKTELAQMHHCICFRALVVAELTKKEKLWAMEGLMFLTMKKSGEVKGRLAYNGKPTH